jgi:localization factor PodJL
MNGSRSNTSGYGGKSSLDQLNRTIEGLEARIQGLVSERKAPTRPYPTAGNPVDEILERQRALSARDRVSAAIERGPRQEPDLRQREEARPQRTWSEPERVTQPAQSAALDDIAGALAALRTELKQGLNTDRLAYDLGEIRNDMRSLKSQAANSHGGDEVIRNELIRLGESIDRLGDTSHVQSNDDLRADLDDLRHMMSGLAREDSLRHFHDRWDRTDASIAAIDPEPLKQELVNLAWRIDEIKTGLGGVNAIPAVRALEDKLIALASSIEALGRNVEARTDLSEQFGWLDGRLDEISRAIAASTSQNAASTDSAAFQRLENRVAELTAHIDMLQAPDRESEIAGQIEALTARIDELANEDAAQRLEERIGQLSKLIERNFREAQPAPEMSTHLADISRKIDSLNAPGDALMERLELLTRKLDELEYPAAAAIPASPVVDHADMSRLESRLAEIAFRLDESVAAPAADTTAIRNLETQIASLSALLSAPGAAPVMAAGDPFAERMTAIEDYLASSDEFIVEAARQAAEAVVEAYSRSNAMPHAAVPADISAIAGLAEDLRALEAHTRSSEERTAETFTALHQTLVQIANRLDDLGEHAAAAPAPAAVRMEREMPRDVEPSQAAAARMPKATQPAFDEIADAMEEPPVRSAPKNSKVDVLQDVDMLLDAADADISADAAAQPPMAPAKEKPASKSLIAGLAAKLMPGKKDKAEARVAIEPAPALDAGEMMVASDNDSLLMEPGSGVPDVKKIMERVRAGQKAGSGVNKPAPAGQADVIAAARRAAQAAAQETAGKKFNQPAAKGKDKDKLAKPAKEQKSIFGAAGESRRPILLAAAAVLLVVMSYPLVSNLIGHHRAAPPPVAQTQNTDIKADKSVNADVNPDRSVTIKPDAKPAAKKAEMGKQRLLAPADNADNATSLEKPDDMAPAEKITIPAADLSKPANADPALSTDKAKPGDDAAAQPTTKDKVTTAETQTDTNSIPAVTPELPAGLQPASLVAAVKKADALAYFEMGSRYTDGRGGMKVDLAEAAKWYQLAAAKGVAPAEYRLASFYEKGSGVPRDLDKARTLYLSAAQKGNASAMHNLAVLYATGAAGNPDFTQAAHWFEAAADLNVRDSQFNLAILYARGSGVKQDLTESYKWFGIAARQGDQDAAQKRDEVANAMSSEQLKAAKAKLDLWKPKDMNEGANNPMVPDEWATKGNTTATIDMKRAIRNIQAILNNNGFDAGKPDGEMGKKTVVAIKAFQKSVGLEPTGQVDDALVKELLKRNKKAA